MWTVQLRFSIGPSTPPPSHAGKNSHTSRTGASFSPGTVASTTATSLIADLRSDLEANPTDVAIVAAAFDRWETDCFRRIIGDWAVSIWKPRTA